MILRKESIELELPLIVYYPLWSIWIYVLVSSKSWWDIWMGVYARRGGSSLEMASGHSLQSLSTKLHPSFTRIFPFMFYHFYLSTLCLLMPSSCMMYSLKTKASPLHQKKIKKYILFHPVFKFKFWFPSLNLFQLSIQKNNGLFSINFRLSNVCMKCQK